MKAGITRAKSLICTVAPDSAALMTVLSAHVIAPEVEIVAKATLAGVGAEIGARWRFKGDFDASHRGEPDCG